MGTGDFRWNQWNLDHATRHGCTIPEITHLVLNPPHGFPRNIGDDKQMITGRGHAGRMIRVIYLLDEDRTYYVIHAMPLTLRRRR